MQSLLLLLAFLLATNTASALIADIPVERPASNRGTGTLVGYSLLISTGVSSSPGDAIASVFAGPTILWFDESDVGSTFSLSSADPGFDEFVTAMSDGVDNNVIVTFRRDFQGNGSYFNGGGIFSDHGVSLVLESVIFGGLTQAELAATTRINFTVDAFGNQSLDAAGTFSFVPEPSAGVLVGLGLVGLGALRVRT